MLAIVLAACAQPGGPPLPGASLTRHFQRAVATRACGDDVAFDGDAAPDVRYSYSYDALGRLVGEIGSYAYSNADETIAFAYDNLDHEMHELDTYPLGGGSTEVTADFDTLGDLVDYTYAVTGTTDDTQHYVMSAFTPTGQPAIEVVSETGVPDAHYVLAYDESSRIVTAVCEGTTTTTYTYDDDGRTVTIDTGAGAFTGTIIYDDDNNELFEAWGGSDPTAVATQTTYDYDGDRMLGMTYESGTPLAIVEVDTLRYCTP